MSDRLQSPLMRFRILRGITQQQLADILEIDRKTVSNWETGKSVPTFTVPQIKKLLKSLDITVEQLPDNFGPQAAPGQESPLKTLRLQAGLTQDELAKQLTNTVGKPISDRMIQDWEEGEYQLELSIPQVRALCRTLEVRFDELADYLYPPLQQEEESDRA